MATFKKIGGKLRYPYSISQAQSGVDADKEFHVSHLKTVLNDVARPNLFKVKINPPAGLDANFGRIVTTLVKSAKIPSITLKEWTYERAGQRLHFPSGEVEYGDVSINFYSDSSMDLRTIFNRWQHAALYNWENNSFASVSTAIAGSVYIYQYDYALRPVYAVALHNAWPTSISEIALSQESENQLEEFTVEFKYSWQVIFKDDEAFES